MKVAKKRIISIILCLSMLVGLVTGIVVGGEKERVYATPDNQAFLLDDTSTQYELNKNASYPLGSAENPFVLLEIVPTLDQAQMGYFIPGCEPIDMELARKNVSMIDGTFSANLSLAYTVSGRDKPVVEYVMYEDIPEDTTEPIYASSEEYKTRVFPNTEYISGSTNGGIEQWVQSPYVNEAKVKGYFYKVESGKGLFQRQFSYNRNINPVPDSNDIMKYVGEGNGDYLWKTTDAAPDSDADKVWMTRNDTFVHSYYNITLTNNDKFIQSCFKNSDGTPVKSESFTTKVISVTPEILAANETNLSLIDKADMISIHTANSFKKTIDMYWCANATKGDGKWITRAESANPEYFAKHDLTNETVIRIMRRMGTANPAALVFESSQMRIGKEYNVSKLYQMALQYESDFFCEKFLDKVEADSVGHDKLYYSYATDANGNPDEAGKSAWDRDTFRYDPDTKADLVDQMRIYQIDGGGTSVFDKLFVYNGDNSLFLTFYDDNPTIESSDKTDLYTNNVTTELFDYYKELGDDSPKKTIQQAMNFILSGGLGNSGPEKTKLRILEIQPCNQFIYDGTAGENGKGKEWKDYYQEIFPWFNPMGLSDYKSNRSWMDNKNYLEIDTMTTYQFNASIGIYDGYETVDNARQMKDNAKLLTTDSSDDLLAKYDLIIIGSNQDTTNGKSGYNDTDLGNLIYTSVGDLVFPDSSRTEKGVSKENTWNKKSSIPLNEVGRDYRCMMENLVESRYSGNDLTLKRMLEIQNFMRAGKPVVVSEQLYSTSGTKKSVDTAKVDKDSKVYDLLTWEDDTDYKGNRYLFIYDELAAQKAAMKRALGIESCRLVFEEKEDYPVEYTYEAVKKRDSGNNELKGVIQGETYMTTTNGVATMEFTFQISGDFNQRYHVNLYLDADGDGVYSSSLKEQNQVVRMNDVLGYYDESEYALSKDAGWETPDREVEDAAQFQEVEGACRLLFYKGKDKSGEFLGEDADLEAGVTYHATYTLAGSQHGIIPWKLEVSRVGNPYVRSSVIDYTAVYNKAPEKLNVLQMNPEKDMSNVSSSQSALFTTKKVKVDGVYNGNLYTDASVSFTDSEAKGQQRLNAERFETYLEPVQEFDVNIQFLQNCDWKKLVGWGSGASEEVMLERWKGFLAQYDMLILGFKDYPLYTWDDYAVFSKGLQDYIAQGKSVIISHDIVMDSGDDSNNVRWSKAKNYVSWLRTISGQRRAYYNKTADGKYEKTYNYVKMNGKTIELAPTTMSTSGASNTMKTLIKAQYLHRLDPAIDGDSMESSLYVTCPYTNEFTDNSIKNYLYSTSGNKSNGTNDKKALSPYPKDAGNWPGQTTNVVLNNQSQITQYPYRLAETIMVSSTHVQNYQLNLDYDQLGDVNVWFNLSGGNKGIYSARPQDSQNNFFIYNKGNVTYTGSGHAGLNILTADETMLFVNTMIAAYRQTAAEPLIQVTNADSVDNRNRAVIYMDYDADVPAVDSGASGVSVSGNLDNDGMVSVKFRLTDDDPTSVVKKHYKFALYDAEGNIISAESLGIKIYEDADTGTALMLGTDKNGKPAYDVKVTKTGVDYTMKVPYTLVQDSGGQLGYKLGVYAEYSRNGITTNTSTSIAQATLMFLPMFDLN